MREIILASASPRRSELLKQVGLDFEVIPSNIEEKLQCDIAPEDFVQNLSYHKALNIAETIKKDAIVLGADTIVVKEGILGKPENEEQAFNMLKKLQGDWHEVITGVTLIDISGMRVITGFERTRVKMGKLSDSFIHAYINTGEPMDKAGAYGIQGYGALLVEEIQGCYFNVVGLPLYKLSSMLKEFEIFILDKRQ